MLAANLYDRLAVEDVNPRKQVVPDCPEGVDVSTGVTESGWSMDH
jgi:hypothetical protein